MKTITLARKPLVGTVAANVLKHGCGGINIAASRIETGDNLNGGAYAKNPTHREGQDVWTQNRKGDTNCFKRGGAGEYTQPKGRFPANLILQHLDGCRCDGVKRVKACGVGAFKRSTGKENGGQVGAAYGAESRSVGTEQINYADKDGKETTANWICEDGCPVKALDGQSGDSISSGGTNARTVGRNGIYGAYDSERGESAGGFGDIGGASRYFKQIGENK